MCLPFDDQYTPECLALKAKRGITSEDVKGTIVELPRSCCVSIGEATGGWRKWERVC